MAKKSLRFGIQDNEGRRAATWKLWTETGGGNSEIYLACRPLGGMLKTSLHQSGNWHIAYSRHAYENDVKGAVLKQKDRFIEKWPRPPEIVPGITLAYRVITPWSAVTHSKESDKHNKVNWVSNAPEGHATEIDIFIVKPTTPTTGWPGKQSMGTSLIGHVPLENGDTVWAVYWVVDMPNINFGKKAGLSFYNGCGIDDLKKAGLRELFFGEEPDGSRVMYDFSVDEKQLTNAIERDNPPR